GVVLIAAFVVWERRTRFPMLPPSMFASRSFTAGNAAIFLTFASLFTGVFFFAQLLQVVLAQDALGAGLRLVPWTVTFLTVAPVAGALADRIGERWLLTTGLLLMAGGYAWLVSVTSTGMTYGDLVGPFVVAGVGVSMAIPCAQNAVVGAVDGESLGKAAGVNSMMRELGGVTGIAVTVAVFVAHSGGGGDTGVVQGFVEGFRPAITVAAGLAVVGAGFGAALPSRRTARVRESALVTAP
ncbi:MAG: MFS transporter, partial [Nocardioides sp.]